MSEQLLIQWLKGEQTKIDNIITSAGIDFHKQCFSKYNFSYDLNECQIESFNLYNGLDLCYDRPNTAFVYSLWYHARRINTFLKFFLKPIFLNQNPKIEIFDLGAGTGAVQFAIAILLEGMKVLNMKVPEVRIINIDSSPIMLDYSRRFLLPKLNETYSSVKNMEIEYNLNSWNCGSALTLTNPWITASYLFDSSDNHSIVAEDFLRIINRYKPQKLLLLSSTQDNKKQIVKSVAEKLKSHKYISEEIVLDDLPLKGPLIELNKLRIELSSRYAAFRMSSAVYWNDPGFFGINLTRTEALLDLSFSNKHIDPLSINLHNKGLKIWREEDLSDIQRKAYRFHGRPSIILGPAGSGKSVVIAEKIKYIVTERGYDPNLRILFTTFNKGLILKVGDWLQQLLDSSKFQRTFLTRSSYGKTYHLESSLFSFKEGINNIGLLNIDLLPTRIGNIAGGWTSELDNIIEDIFIVIKEDLGIGSEYDEILNREFIQDEYYKIFYGRLITDITSYLEVKRVGMWKPLGQKQREIVYRVIYELKQYLKSNNLKTVYSTREEFLEAIQANKVAKFDYIFIDEFQDFTETDFKIIYGLIKDVNNITFAGDLGQSIHIGHTASVPRDENMSNIQKFSLEGSYRVPFRICECISDLSGEIAKRFKNNEGAQILAPVKNSPPGARPIVLYGKTITDLIPKIVQIWQEYSHYGLTEISILEKDEDLKFALNKDGVKADSFTILGLKGLEKDCILWATHIPVNDTNEVYEFIYTILTRSSNIIIIAITDDIQEYYKKVIVKLRQERLILYDEETKSMFNTFCKAEETMLPSE